MLENVLMNAFKENVETENRQRRALTDEEAEQVAGGVDFTASSEPDFEMPNCNCKHGNDSVSSDSDANSSVVKAYHE